MMIKLLCAAVVLIPALIAVLIFYIAHALFSAPGALLGTIQPTIAVLCIVAGVVLLIPAAIVLVVALVNLAGRKNNHQPN